MTVNELLLAYLNFAENHYRGVDGTPTDEVRQIKAALRPVKELYGMTLVSEFGPMRMKAVRERYVSAGWCRKTVNARVERVRRVIKWAVGEELVPPTIHQALCAVGGLKRGRTTARESEPVAPVDDEIVDATLAHLNRHVRGLVEIQRLTGCRPGEARRMRWCDIDTSGPVWLYRPTEHKGSWRGKTRAIAIGPKAQAVIAGFVVEDAGTYLFCPRRAVEEGVAERAAARKTPRWPSHTRRNERKRVGQKRKRPPAERYTRLSYITAVARACDRAFPPPPPLDRKSGESVAKWWARLTSEQVAEVKTWQKAHRWRPNQLRHAFGTKVRRMHGLEAAQVLLGHAKADVTQVYAAKNERVAIHIASEIG